MSPLKRVSVSDRAKIIVYGKLLLRVSLNGIKRGKRELWPFGGGVSVTQKEIEALANDFGACDFEGHEHDLRFKLPAGEISRFRQWFNRLPSSNRNVVRELIEEAEEYDLPIGLFRQIRFSLRPARIIEATRSDWSYLTLPVRPVQTLCFDRIYTSKPSASVAAVLKEIALVPDSLLDLVTPKEIRRGRSNKGSDIPETCRILL